MVDEKVIGLALGATGLLARLSKPFVMRRYRGWRDGKQARDAALAAVPGLVAKVNEMYTQIVTGNGGSTIRDTVRRMSNRLTMAEHQITSVIGDKPTFVLDEQGKWTAPSRSLLRLLDCTADDVRGYGWMNQITAPDNEIYLAELQRAIAQRRDCKMRVKLRWAGAMVTIHTIAVLDESSAQLVGYIGIVEHDRA